MERSHGGGWRLDRTIAEFPTRELRQLCTQLPSPQEDECLSNCSILRWISPFPTRGEGIHCSEAVYDTAATSAIFQTHPLERQMRDIQTACQHRVVHGKVYRPAACSWDSIPAPRFSRAGVRRVTPWVAAARRDRHHARGAPHRQRGVESTQSSPRRDLQTPRP